MYDERRRPMITMTQDASGTVFANGTVVPLMTPTPVGAFVVYVDRDLGARVYPNTEITWKA